MQNQLLKVLRAASSEIFVITAITGLINCVAPTLSQQNNTLTTNMNQAKQFIWTG